MNLVCGKYMHFNVRRVANSVDSSDHRCGGKLDFLQYK